MTGGRSSDVDQHAHPILGSVLMPEIDFAELVKIPMHDLMRVHIRLAMEPSGLADQEKNSAAAEIKSIKIAEINPPRAREPENGSNHIHRSNNIRNQEMNLNKIPKCITDSAKRIEEHNLSFIDHRVSWDSGFTPDSLTRRRRRGIRTHGDCRLGPRPWWWIGSGPVGTSLSDSAPNPVVVVVLAVKMSMAPTGTPRKSESFWAARTTAIESKPYEVYENWLAFTEGTGNIDTVLSQTISRCEDTFRKAKRSSSTYKSSEKTSYKTHVMILWKPTDKDRGNTGTGITPALIHPKNASINSKPGRCIPMKLLTTKKELEQAEEHYIPPSHYYGMHTDIAVALHQPRTLRDP
uniref:Uncharacterized protein n=1 Tax=Oryza rufipogon TaxID=4529 RepID=A0A0E0PAF2_ORYRU